MSALTATATLPVVPALPITAALFFVATLPATATLSRVVLDPATATLSRVTVEPATATLRLDLATQTVEPQDGSSSATRNDEPQPQAATTFGLITSKPEPIRLSVKSTLEPST